MSAYYKWPVRTKCAVIFSYVSACTMHLLQLRLYVYWSTRTPYPFACATDSRATAEKESAVFFHFLHEQISHLFMPTKRGRSHEQLASSQKLTASDHRDVLPLQLESDGRIDAERTGIAVPAKSDGEPRSGISWQCQFVRRIAPSVAAGLFRSTRSAEPNVSRLRAWAHLLSLPQRVLSALRLSGTSLHMDRTLCGEWIFPRSDLIMPGAVILYLHGDGYYLGSPATHRAVTRRLASDTQVRVLALDYRLTPEHPFPAALNDGLRLLLDRGIAPSSIVFAADSVGGGLVLAILLALRDNGEPLPAGAVLLSPWLNMRVHEAQTEAPDGPNQLAVETAAQMYLGKAPTGHLLVSPMHAPLDKLCPLHIQVSDSELFYSDALQVTDMAKCADVSVELSLWRRLPHAWHCYASLLPEADAALGTAAAFMRRLFASPRDTQDEIYE
jgi:monoterpene epsilon-lactone hydrolase